MFAVSLTVHNEMEEHVGLLIILTDTYLVSIGLVSSSKITSEV